MDEKQIKAFTKKTIKLLKKDKTFSISRLVFFCHKTLKSKKLKAQHILLSSNPYVEKNTSININYWFEFIVESDIEIITSIIFEKILNFKEEDIAHGLGISLGTLRYRIGKGLAQLGDIIG